MSSTSKTDLAWKSSLRKKTEPEPTTRGGEAKTLSELAAAVCKPVAASEVQEPKAAGFMDQFDAQREGESAELDGLTVATMDRIEIYLQALQQGLSRIESKLGSLVS